MIQLRASIGLVFASLFFLVGMAGAAQAADYYVSAQASGGGDGSEARPFQDIGQCADIMGPGDTCHIMNGLYQSGWRAYRPKRSGEPNNPITFKAYPGHGPVIESEGGYGENLGVADCTLGWFADGIGTSYIRYEGLRVHGTICVYGAGMGTYASRGIEIVGNEIWGGSWRYDLTNVAGILVQDVIDVEIRDNIIRDITSPSYLYAGILNFGSIDMVVENNLFDDAGNGVFDKDSSDGTIIRRNIFKGGTSRAYVWFGNNLSHVNKNARVYENIFQCPSENIRAVWVGNDVEDTLIYNNTFHNCGEPNGQNGNDSGAIHMGSIDDRDNPRNRIFNNIFYADSGDSFATYILEQTGRSAPELMDYNLYFATSGAHNWWINRYAGGWVADEFAEWKSTGYDQNGLVANPMFVSPGADYRLQASSPARGRGCAITSACAGPDGSVDLGAYPRRDDTVIGPGGTPPPVDDTPIIADPPEDDPPPPPAEDPIVVEDPPASAASCASPEAGWVVCEDFESGSIASWDDVNDGGGVLRVVGSPTTDGAYALGGFAQAGTNANAWMTRYFADHPELGGAAGSGQEEVFFSSRVRFSSGFEYNSVKMFILGSFDAWTANYPGPNSWAPFYLLLQVDVNGEPEGVVHDKTSGESAWRAMHRNVGPALPLQSDRWYRLDYRVRMNDVGQANGVFQIWIDGSLTVDYQDVVYRTTNTAHDWNHFTVTPYQSNAPSSNQSQYWDQVVLSTAPTVDGGGAGAPAPTGPPEPPVLIGISPVGP